MGVATVLRSSIFSLLSAALPPHLLCGVSRCHIFPFQQHFCPNLLLPPTLHARGKAKHKTINPEREPKSLVQSGGSAAGAEVGYPSALSQAKQGKKERREEGSSAPGGAGAAEEPETAGEGTGYSPGLSGGAHPAGLLSPRDFCC